MIREFSFRSAAGVPPCANKQNSSHKDLSGTSGVIGLSSETTTSFFRIYTPAAVLSLQLREQHNFIIASKIQNQRKKFTLHYDFTEHGSKEIPLWIQPILLQPFSRNNPVSHLLSNYKAPNKDAFRISDFTIRQPT